jgi:uncharacterized membrane protein
MATAPEVRAAVTDEEDRLLRLWTPVLLRTILFTAIALLLAGLVASIIAAPGHYTARFHELQQNLNLRSPEDFWTLIMHAAHGDGHALMTIGLMVLTMVPIGRVGFTFFLFLREKDYPFVVMTAYVLAALVLGAALGRIG